MAKKEVRKTKSVTKITRDAENLNKILVENFTSLQKVLTNLAIKFEDLSIQISKLLQLFEISAKSFSEKLATSVPEIEKDREFLNKLNTLLEQNKVIAKGLTLMEEKIRERVYGSPPQQPSYPQRQYPIYPATPKEQGYIASSLEKERKTIEQE